MTDPCDHDWQLVDESHDWVPGDRYFRCARCDEVDVEGRLMRDCGKFGPTLLTLPTGGLSVVDNLQTLCETCNKRKQREDRAATAAAKQGGA